MINSPSDLSMESWLSQEIEATQKKLNFLQEIKKQIIDTQLMIETRNFKLASEEDADICAICQVEYEGKERIAKLRCGHEYHGDCIKNWLVEKNVCPLCKSPGIDYL